MITKEIHDIIKFKRSILHNKWGIECIITLGDGEIPPRVTYKLSNNGLLVLKYVEDSIQFFREAFMLYNKYEI